MAAKKKATPKAPDKVEFKYIFENDYNPVYANGAVGGIGSQGDLVINFYHERNGVPYSQTHSVDLETMAMGPEISRDPTFPDKIQFVRFVTAGVVMDMACARRIHGWLGTKIAQADAKSDAKTKKK